MENDLFDLNKVIYEDALKEVLSSIETEDITDALSIITEEFFERIESQVPEMVEYLLENYPPTKVYHAIDYHTNSQHQLFLGIFYLAIDQQENSFLEISKAARSMNPHAQYLLGCFYGKEIGLYKNLKLGFFYIRSAAEQRIPAAYFALAQYYNGDHEHNHFVCHQKTVNSRYAGSKPFLSIAIAYEGGIGTLCDIHEAIYWGRKGDE
ncbi:11702_t:CDS:1, partial [Ambispora gerdemannii]